MMPVVYNNGNQIIQAPGYVAFHNEMIHETRIIPLDGRESLPAAMKSYMGSSRGHWEGNTLVVRTTNLNGKTGMQGNGMMLIPSDSIESRSASRRSALNAAVRGDDQRPEDLDAAVEGPVPAASAIRYQMFDTRVTRATTRCAILCGSRADEKTTRP